ncbi:MAG: hypothetical protein ACHQ7N_21155 [Candidatus Methylomirabilales bacterium]
MFTRSLLVVPLVLSLMGCVSGQAPVTSSPVSLDTFAHRVGSAHVVLYWNCQTPEPGRLQFDGIAQSPWSEVRSLEFELVGVDIRDRLVSQTKGEARDPVIRTRQLSPFRLELRTVGSEVRFDLFYQHQFVPQGMDALLAGLPMARPRLHAQADRFLARDVCSETQHRAR